MRFTDIANKELSKIGKLGKKIDCFVEIGIHVVFIVYVEGEIHQGSRTLVGSGTAQELTCEDEILSEGRDGYCELLKIRCPDASDEAAERPVVGYPGGRMTSGIITGSLEVDVGK